VKTVFGPVSLDLAQDWPVIASYDELARYAQWTGCRIPTYEEVRSIYLYADQLRGTKITNGHRYVTSNLDISHVSKADIRFSNGTNGTSHEVNGTSNGITHMTNGANKNSSTAETPVFRALDGCNVGFQNWHPVPVTPNGGKLAGQGDLGGVWEWTSTPLTAHEGFKAMEIYPGYTCKPHNVDHPVSALCSQKF
jgi:formylglycine-generating enzyme required for sulfatase activity